MTVRENNTDHHEEGIEAYMNLGGKAPPILCEDVDASRRTMKTIIIDLLLTPFVIPISWGMNYSFKGPHIKGKPYSEK